MKSLFKKAFISVTSLFLTLLLISCGSVPEVNSNQEEQLLFPSEYYIPSEYNWLQIEPGIDYAVFKSRKMKLTYHLVKIDLSNQNLELLSYPSPDQAENLDSCYTPKSTKQFARENNCTVAFNATPFEIKSVVPYTVSLVGIQKTNDIYTSDCIPRYSAIAFDKDKAYIIKQQTKEECNKYDYVFGGFFSILYDGEEQTFKRHSYDSRTAVGITKEGSTIYILAVEGENKLSSIGLSYQMCTRIFQALDCYNAIQLDGGSSTELCINGKSVLSPAIRATQANSIGFRMRKE